MIKVKIYGPKGPRVAKLPLDKSSLGRELELVGINTPAAFVPLSRAGEWNMEISGTNDVDGHLFKMCFADGSLESLNQAAAAVKGAHKLVQPALKQRIISDRYHSVEELKTAVSELSILASAAREAYYFPLQAELRIGGECLEAEENVLFALEDRLRESFAVYTREDSIGYANSYFGPGRGKLLFAKWGFEELQEGLYGRVNILLTEPLTEAEDQGIREWIGEQNREGLWEAFARQGYNTDFGEVTVRFGGSVDEIQTQAEMDEMEGGYVQSMG